MMTIYLTPALLRAINTITAAGHGVELDEGGGGNSHTNTIITIGVRAPGAVGYVRKLKVKYTSSYSGQFDDFLGISPEFGKACYWQAKTIDGLVKIAAESATA